MCLIPDKKIKNKKPNKDGFCIGWKIIRKGIKGDERYYGYCMYKWKYNEGLNISNRRLSQIAMTFNDEIKNSQIGFHLFLSRKDTRNFLKWNNTRCHLKTNNERIVKVLYKPKDVVSYGFLDWGANREFNGFKPTDFDNVVVECMTIPKLP